MKKTIGLLALAIGLTSALYAQDKKAAQATPTPEAKAAFARKFPGATNVKWEREDNLFEAGFKQNGQEMSALYTSSGTLTETETEIALTALPAGVTKYLQQHYPGKKVKEAAKIVKADGTVNYEAEIDKTDVLFDAGGKFIKEAKD